MSSYKLYQSFNRNDRRGLVSKQFFAALNIHLGVKTQLLKITMREFSSNFSMQALSKSNDNILSIFTQIDNVASNINSLIRIRIF